MLYCVDCCLLLFVLCVPCDFFDVCYWLLIVVCCLWLIVCCLVFIDVCRLLFVARSWLFVVVVNCCCC